MKFQVEKMKFPIFIQLNFKKKFLENSINFAYNLNLQNPQKKYHKNDTDRELLILSGIPG